MILEKQNKPPKNKTKQQTNKQQDNIFNVCLDFSYSIGMKIKVKMGINTDSNKCQENNPL